MSQITSNSQDFREGEALLDYIEPFNIVTQLAVGFIKTNCTDEVVEKNSADKLYLLLLQKVFGYSLEYMHSAAQEEIATFLQEKDSIDPILKVNAIVKNIPASLLPTLFRKVSLELENWLLVPQDLNTYDLYKNITEYANTLDNLYQQINAQ